MDQLIEPTYPDKADHNIELYYKVITPFREIGQDRNA